MTRIASRLRSPSGPVLGLALLVALLLSAWLPSSGSSAAAIKGKGLASESPAQILVAAQSALRSARGFVFTARGTEDGEVMRIQVVDGGSSKLQMRINEAGQKVEIILLPRAGYIRANHAFWAAHGAATAADAAANRWIAVPVATIRQLAEGLGLFAPDTLATCLGEDHGTLRRIGTTTVDGQPAVVIDKAGNVPGGNPGTLTVTTNGPAYPLRLTATGPRRPGGKIDACDTGSGGNVEGTIIVTDFNHAPAVIAPKDLLNLNAVSSASQ